MRFPSINALARDAGLVLVRFPWTMAAAAVATAAGMTAVGAGVRDQWVRLTMVALLGLPLTMAVGLLGWRRGWVHARTAVLQVAGILALVAFYFAWPGPQEKHNAIRYLQLSAGLHLLVAFLPFAAERDQVAFWQYNRRLFEGFLRAALFSAVLFFGLAIAVVSLDKLFGVRVPNETYPRLWILLAFLVHPWIFAGGLPKQAAHLTQAAEYPRGLKIFTQYVLTPLVAVYLVMLTAYLAKIVFSGSWPSGWVGYLVASVAVTGVLGFLLIYPLRLGEGDAWIRTYSRWLFIGLMPAAVMFLLALWKRAEPYGLTELRVLGFLLGGWLLGLALLYTVRRDFGIRVIPVSLAAILLLSLYGPFSVTRVALRSQGARLRELLGTPGEDQPHVSRTREISAAARFLLKHGAQADLRQALRGGVPGADSLLARRDSLTDSTVAAILGTARLRYEPEGYNGTSSLSLTLKSDSSARAISGYDYEADVGGPGERMIFAGGDTLRVRSDSGRAAVELAIAGISPLVIPFDNVLQPPPPGEMWEREMPTVRMQARAVRGNFRAMLVLSWVRAEPQADTLRVTDWRGRLYWSRPAE